jgi:hypothetical protein
MRAGAGGSAAGARRSTPARPEEKLATHWVPPFEDLWAMYTSEDKLLQSYLQEDIGRCAIRVSRALNRVRRPNPPKDAPELPAYHRNAYPEGYYKHGILLLAGRANELYKWLAHRWAKQHRRVAVAVAGSAVQRAMQEAAGADWKKLLQYREDPDTPAFWNGLKDRVPVAGTHLPRSSGVVYLPSCWDNQSRDHIDLYKYDEDAETFTLGATAVSGDYTYNRLVFTCHLKGAKAGTSPVLFFACDLKKWVENGPY